MKKVFLTVMVALLVMVSNAAKIDGKWKTSMRGPDGNVEITFVFKADGEKLTGTITSPMGEMEITKGKINGDEFTFDIDMMGNTISHKGRFEGDVIKLKMDMPQDDQGGSGNPNEMTLIKVQ